MTRRGQLAEGDVHACATAPLNKTPPNFPPATQIHVCSGLTDKQSINEINEPPWYWDKDHRSPTALRAIFWTAGHWSPLRFNILRSSSPLNPTLLSLGNRSGLQMRSGWWMSQLKGSNCFEMDIVVGSRPWDKLAWKIDGWPLSIHWRWLWHLMFGRGPPPPSTSDTPQNTRHVVSLIEWLDAEWYLLLQPSILTTLPLANMKMDHGVYSHRVKRGSARAAFRTHKLCNLSLCFSQREMHTHPCISSEPPSASIRSSFSVGRIKSDK